MENLQSFLITECYSIIICKVSFTACFIINYANPDTRLAGTHHCTTPLPSASASTLTSLGQPPMIGRVESVTVTVTFVVTWLADRSFAVTSTIVSPTGNTSGDGEKLMMGLAAQLSFAAALAAAASPDSSIVMPVRQAGGEAALEAADSSKSTVISAITRVGSSLSSAVNVCSIAQHTQKKASDI